MSGITDGTVIDLNSFMSMVGSQFQEADNEKEIVEAFQV